MRLGLSAAFVIALAALSGFASAGYYDYGVYYSSGSFNAYYHSYSYPPCYYPCNPCCGLPPVVYAPLRYPYYTPPINPHYYYYYDTPAYRAPVYSTPSYDGCSGYWGCSPTPSTTYFADDSYSGAYGSSGYYGSTGSYYPSYPSYTYTRSYGYSFE